MSKGKEKSRSKTRSPDRRYRSREWTDTTIQAILDAAPSDEARKVLLGNPNMMKALLRRASRHTSADGAADTSIFKRIFADEVFNSPPDVTSLRQREDRLRAEMQRAQEAELRLLEAQAKVNQLILEKQKANMAAEQAKEEAKGIHLRLELVRQDIEQRNDAMKKLEEDYDKLDQEAARIRSENYKLKLKEAHAAGRAEGRNEGRTMGRREGENRGYEEGYGAGFALGSRDMADKLMKYLDEDDVRLAQDGASRPPPGHAQEASGSTQAPPVSSDFQELRDPGKRSSERGRDRDRERERRHERSQRQPQPIPAVQVQSPSSQSSVQSTPPKMPEPVIPQPRSPSPARSVTPTPAQQVIRDYHESPERFEPPIPIRNVSPQPHVVRNPLPDTFIPVVSENDPDGLMFNMPAAHAFSQTPSATAQPLPSQHSPRHSPQMYSYEALAPQHSGSNIPAFIPSQNTGSGSHVRAQPFIPPTRELPQPTQAKPSSVRSRDNRHGRSDSPDRSSTPLSEMSILQRQAEDDAGIYMPYTYQLKRNHSVLSVIQEQSDTDGTSPIAQRMSSQSPGLRRPQYEAAPMQMPTPTLSYIPAPLDGSMGVNHPPPQDESARYPPPMVPNPGQPRVRQFDEARQRQAANPSPVMPTYAVAPLPEDPTTSFVPIMPSEVPMQTPFVPPQNRTPEPTPPPPATVSRSSTKKGKKDKKRSQEPAPVPDVQIIPPSDQSESSYNRLSQIDVQPEEQPPQLSSQRTPQRTPQRSPLRMPVPPNLVNSDSEDSTAGRRAPPIAPQPPPPPAFVPKTAATPPPAPVPFIPPPPVINKPPTPPPVIPVATGTSRKGSKGKKGRSRQQAVVPSSPVRVSTPITMPVPEVVQPMSTFTGEVVMELPPDATIASIAPGTVLSPVMADGTGMYEPAFVPPSPVIHAPTPRVPRSPVLPILSQTPSPTRSRTPEVQPVVPASAVPNKNPKGFVPKDIEQPVAFGYRTPMVGHGHQKVPLGRPNPTAAYSLTSRTPRIPTGMATGDGLPAVTPEPGPEARLPVVPNSVASSSPMAPPGSFDGGPVIPQFTGSQQYTGSRQHTGSQQYGIPHQRTGSQQYGIPHQQTGSQQYGIPQQQTGSDQYGIPQQQTGSQEYGMPQQYTGSQQYGMPQQHTGSQQYGMPQQYEVPQQYTGAHQPNGSRQHTGSQQYSSSQQNSGSQSYAGWGRVKRPDSSEPRSPFVPSLDHIPASTPYVPPVNLVAGNMHRPHPSPRHSPNRHATEPELTSPVVPPSETYSSHISAAPVQQPGPGPRRGFVPPSAALNAAGSQPKIPRPRGDRQAMPLTGRVYKSGPLTMATPEPQPVVQPIPVAVPEPEPVEPEGHPEVPNQTRPRPRGEPQHKGILKKQGAVFPEPEAVAASPYPQVKSHRSGGGYGGYEPAPQPVYGYRTPGPTAQPLPLGMMTPNLTSRPGTAEPWAHAPQDFQPPGFPVGAAAVATPRTAVSVFDKDFKTPRTIFEPISSDQSSIYNPNSPDEHFQSLSGATPGFQYTGLPEGEDDEEDPEPFIPQPTGGSSSGFVPPGVRHTTGGSSSGFVPSAVPRPTGGSSSGFVPSGVSRPTGGSSSGFVPSSVPLARPTGGSSSGFVPSGVPRPTGGSSAGFVPPSVSQATGGSSSGFVPPGVPTGMGSLSSFIPGVQRVRDTVQSMVPSFTGYRQAPRKTESVMSKTPRVSVHSITDEEDEPKFVPPPREPTPPPPSPPRPARKTKGKGSKRR